MGKKVKGKDSVTPSRETFDPLLFEAKTPATVVLLLSSPEEDILIKTCEAVHAFADRGDENKVSLLGLGALGPLCQLINHSNKLIRRYAFMALGIMSTHAEVKYAMKKMNIISSIIEKLSPTEETVVHEFGTLCLASLSEDLSKDMIFDNNGILPVIGLLSSPDPDVVKNSLEIIFNQIQDNQRHFAIHDLGGIPLLLEKLKSDFPVIQHLALKILQNITTDKETRTTFRGEQGFEKLIEVLKNKDLHDLHSGALQLIANCLNDSECFHLIHKGGGLGQLMEFILSPSMPEIQANAVKCIAGVAQSSENRSMLHEQNVEKVLVELLSVNDDRVKTAAIQAVSAMCSNLASKEVFRELGGISTLVQLLRSECLAVKREATRALSDLTCTNYLNIFVMSLKGVYEENGHEMLVQLLKESCPVTVASAAATLRNMAGREDIRNSILSHGAMQVLVEPLKSTDTKVLVSAVQCVAILACITASRTEFKNARGLPPLVNLLDSNDTDVQKYACSAVNACASDEHSAVEMCVLGALEKLKKINQSDDQKSESSESALTILLDFNLSVKYSMRGFLSDTDCITDGFYDAGKAVTGQRVLSLEEHYSQPINQHRAIIVINTAEDKREKDKPKDKEMHNTVPPSPIQKHCKMMSDPSLQALLQQAEENVLPLDNKRKQYTALARLVSQAMGGAVEMEKMHEFEWTLHISKLKFELQSNVVPIGMINKGIYYHRALLFKCLSDYIGMKCTLFRGEYNRAWNEVPILNGQLYVVDLMHNPGSLMKVNTPVAEQYQTI